MEKMTGLSCSNIVIGHCALTTSTESSDVIAIGEYCMNDSTTASSMIYIGNTSAQLSTENYQCICIGHVSGYNSGGTWSIHIGNQAGYAYNASDTNNITLGHNISGSLGQSNCIKIGNRHNSCYISGIYGMNPILANKTLIINSDGQIGTVNRLPINFTYLNSNTRFVDT
jgi:hypothetical protein